MILSLIVKPNEFVVVVGQSGGGKTTLMDAIAGFRPATMARYLWMGSMYIEMSAPCETRSGMSHNAISSIWS